jgi:hypothetical protein
MRAVFEKLFGLTPKTAGWVNDLILQILAVTVIAIVIYRIAKIILNKEGQWVFGKSTTQKIMHESDIEKNLIHVDFEKLIEEAIAKSDYRAGVRLVFLYALKMLSDKNHIHWNQGKTNHDYLDELKLAELKSGFSDLNYYFEYAWYGNFKINAEIMAAAKPSRYKLIKASPCRLKNPKSFFSGITIAISGR